MGDDDRIVDDSDDNLGSDQEPESDNDNDQKTNRDISQD